MKIGLIGAGGIAEAHSNAYKLMDDIVIAAVVDPSLEKAEELAKLYSAHAYRSHQEMLHSEPSLDMVDICAPSHLHPSIAMDCMNSGVHVLCEKPIAHTLENAKAMIETAKRCNVYFMVAQVVRFMEEYQYLKKCVDEGAFGEVRQASFTRLCQAPTWGGWYVDPKVSGKAPFELHIHDTDFIVHLFGMPRTVDSVSIDDDASFTSSIKTRYGYEDDKLVDSEGSWTQSPIPFAMEYRVIFEKAVLELRTDKLMLYPHGEQARQVTFHEAVDVEGSINLKGAGGIYNEIRYFIEHIRSDKKLAILTPEQSYDTLLVLRKELDSAQLGAKLDIADQDRYAAVASRGSAS